MDQSGGNFQPKFAARNSGLGLPCKACANKYLKEINAQLFDLVPYGKVRRWLAERGEVFSIKTIHMHAKYHIGIDVKRDARARAAEKLAEEMRNAKIEETSERIVADVSLIDRVAAVNIRIVEKLGPLLEDGCPSLPTVQLFNHASAMVIKCVVDRHSIMTEDKPNAEIPKIFSVQLQPPVRPEEKSN